jgi:hypothetical protein
MKIKNTFYDNLFLKMGNQRIKPQAWDAILLHCKSKRSAERGLAQPNSAERFSYQQTTS